MNPSILIAEEDSTAGHALRSMLDRWKYPVRLASDGIRAWEVLQQKDPPRLAILNWTLPAMDGVQICRKIRRQTHGPYIYILLSAPPDHRQEVFDGMEAGADDYLTKPFNPEELKMRLRAGQRILALQDELLAARELLQAQITRDTLTGLWNRSAILDLLRKELDRSRRENTSVGVAIAQLDHLPRVHDTYGLLTRDAVLREIGRRLRRSMRPYDAVGWYGEDLFLILAPGCGQSSMLRLAERLRTAISAEAVSIPEGTHYFTLSLGVFSSGEAPAASEDLLLYAAGAALQRAKDRGCQRVESATLADVMARCLPD